MPNQQSEKLGYRCAETRDLSQMRQFLSDVKQAIDSLNVGESNAYQRSFEQCMARR